MAYSNSFYSGYNQNPAFQGGYTPQYQPAANYPISAPQIAQIPAQQPSSSPIWVQGEEGAKAYLIAPGTSVILMDSENNTFYIKSSDQSGVPMPLRIFDYVERTAASKPTALPKQQADFVTREEFTALENRLNELMSKGQTLAKGDIDNG